MRTDPRTGVGVVAMSNTTKHWNISALADSAIDTVLAAR